MTTRTRIDRAALVRRALLELVAEFGFHGVSMSAVAKRAGVAAGTIYVHYESKDALVMAVHREVKRSLGAAAVAETDEVAAPRDRFLLMWRNAFDHLIADPVRARFLVQFDASPYAAPALVQALEEEEDEFLAAASAPDIVRVLADLPMELLYDLGFGPAVRLAARSLDGVTLGHDQLDRLAAACWRAVTRPRGGS